MARNLLGGYRESELIEAFNRVKNKEDWKAPIRAVLGPTTEAELALIEYAIQFYTATTARVTHKVDANGTVTATLIEADGYRAGPAGDH